MSNVATRAPQLTISVLTEVLFFFFFFLACTCLAVFNAYPGDVHPNTSEVYMWSTLGFHLIYTRHPPLLPWIVGVVDWLIPVNYLVLAALSGLNVTLAAFAVWRIARLTLGDARAPLVAAIYCLSPYTLWHAVKFDHNAILLSIWPFVVWAFLLSLRDPSWWRGLILGLASAAAIYAKYTSALLLFAVAVAAIVSPRRASYFRGPAPYVALATTALLATPLAWAAYQDWLVQQVHFALNQAVAYGTLPVKMLATNVSRLLPVLAGFGLLYYWIGGRQTESTRALRELLIVALLPYLLMVGITVALGLRGSQAWPMPVFAFVPILLVSLLRAPRPDQLSVLYRAFPFLLCVIPLVGVGMLTNSFWHSNRNIVEPTRELAGRAASIWRRAIARPVKMVAGDYRMAMAASLALPDHPRAWPLFRGAGAAGDGFLVSSAAPWWVTADDIDRGGMLIFCKEAGQSVSRSVDRTCNTRAGQFIKEYNGWSCLIEGHRTLFGMTGPVLRIRAYFVPPRSARAEQTCMPQG